MERLTYAVIGTGAIGGFYGGKLANNQQKVHFLFHKDYEFVKKEGLRVDSVGGDFLLQNVNAYKQTQDMPPCDVVIVSLKTVNNKLLPDILKPLIRKGTSILLIQNGLGMEADLASTFPNTEIIGAMAFICSNKIGPGHIKHLDYGALTMGCFHDAPSDRLAQISMDFQEAGVPVVVAKDLQTARWRKLVWNIPFNGMTVVLHTQTDRLMKLPATRKLLHDLMDEVIEAGRKCGADISSSFADEMMASTDKMRPYSPSMLLDYENKRPMELDYMYRNPIQQAAQKGYCMKKTQMLEQLLRFTEQQNLNPPI